MDDLIAIMSSPPLLLVGLIVGFTLIGYAGQARKRPLTRKPYYNPRLIRPIPSRRSDPVQQAGAAGIGDYFAKRVLSPTEAKVLRAAERVIEEAGLPWRVLAQVALGEVLGSTDEAAFHAINAKRTDLLIVAADFTPIAAIEYQGSGHHLGSDAYLRDAIKREALRKAGVGFIEIHERHGQADIRREILAIAQIHGHTAKAQKVRAYSRSHGEMTAVRGSVSA